jgi:hypothetical protein
LRQISNKASFQRVLDEERLREVTDEEQGEETDTESDYTVSD